MTDTEKLKIDFWKRLSESPFVMVGLGAGRFRHEPLMAHFDENVPDTMWFFVAKDSRLAPGGWAEAEFVSKGHDYFAGIAGDLSTEADHDLIAKFWSNRLEAYFPGGPTDPALALLRFEITEAELWDIDLGLAGKLRLVFGGTFNPAKDGLHAVVHSTST